MIGISAGPPASGFTRLAQQVSTTGAQTTIGYLGFFGKKVGNGCDLTIQLFTNVSSKPGVQQGTASVTLPADFWPTSNGWVYAPLPTAGLAVSGTYQAVLIAGDVNGNNAGDSSNYVTLEKSNQVTGASTFAASTWTNQAYGFMFREFDQAASGDLTFIYEDAGARWTYMAYDGSGNLSAVNEYTLAQGAGQVRSVRTMTLSSGLIVSVS